MADDGLSFTLKGIKKAGDQYLAAFYAALYQEALSIMAVSVRRVPVDTGRLRSSHYVAPPTDRGECELGYGTDYALPVHDRVEVHHNTGGPLYLRSALDEAKTGFQDRMARRTESNYRAGIGVQAIPATAPTSSTGEK